MGLTHQKERGCERERRVFEGCVAGARDRQAGCEAKTRSAVAKRKNGEGSIHKLPNGRWRAPVLRGDAEGRKRRSVRSNTEDARRLRANQLGVAKC